MAWLGVEPMTDSLQKEHLTIAPLRIFCKLTASSKLYIINISWNKKTFINH